MTMMPTHRLSLPILLLLHHLDPSVAHEYMRAPMARTDTCLLNGVIMGDKICQTIKKGDDQQ